MERDAEGSRNTDAQILAQLRRRSAASNDRSDDYVYGADAEQNVAESNAPISSNEERAEALKRLTSSKTPKEPMSALSSTLRNLREELSSVDVVSLESSDDSGKVDVDASLDLIEAELNFQARQDSSDVNAKSADQGDGAIKSAHEQNAYSLENANVENVPKQNWGLNSTSGAESNDATVGLLNAAKTNAASVGLPNVLSETRVENKPNAMSSVSELLVVSNLKKGYVKGKKLIPVLQGVDLNVHKGELLAVVGQSGSGKSTLLHLMGTLDIPDSGTIHFDGQRIDNLPSAQRDVLRNRFIGMIFQFYHLIPEMTTLENVLAPLMIRDSIFGFLRKRSKYVDRAKELLDLVGLSHRLRHRPNELSGGEMQRASIARALITEPRVLLADEPTGNLDSKASLGVLELLRKLNKEKNLTIVMVTHDMSQARDSDRAVRIVDGMIVKE